MAPVRARAAGQLDHSRARSSHGDAGECPVWVRLLGGFRLQLEGQATALRSGGKGEALLASLALRGHQGAPAELILTKLWADRGPLALQALYSLTYSLNRRLASALDGSDAIVYFGGFYRLNYAAGVAVDLMRFTELSDAAERCQRNHDQPGAARLQALAVDLYQGDLSAGSDVEALIEREQLRSRYLSLLTQLGHYHLAHSDAAAALRRAQQLLKTDPYREDAHRLAMRCYVRLGERVQALRQYRLCEMLMRREFDTRPEQSTVDLFEQVRCAPESV